MLKEAGKGSFSAQGEDEDKVALLIDLYQNQSFVPFPYSILILSRVVLVWCLVLHYCPTVQCTNEIKELLMAANN